MAIFSLSYVFYSLKHAASIARVLFLHLGKASSVNDKITTRYSDIVSVFDVACVRISFCEVVM